MNSLHGRHACYNIIELKLFCQTKCSMAALLFDICKISMHESKVEAKRMCKLMLTLSTINGLAPCCNNSSTVSIRLERTARCSAV